MLRIEKLKESDASCYLHLLESLLDGDDTSFVYENHELPKTDKMIELANNKTIFVAKIDNKMVGYVAMDRGKYKRTMGTYSISMGVERRNREKGIGRALIMVAINHVKKNKAYRVELKVNEENTKAIRLYLKCGFKIEGHAQKSAFINGKYINKLYMSTII